MKKNLCLVLAAFAAIALVGCGSSEETSDTNTPAAPASSGAASTGLQDASSTQSADGSGGGVQASPPAAMPAKQ